jgi:hypothetical protein
MPDCCGYAIRSLLAAGLALMLLTRSAVAGPPYISDDPEPTDYKHFEIYTFSLGTTTRGGTTSQAGIDFNYGAAPDLQLTATIPAGFDQSFDGSTSAGFSNAQLAAKYRFLHQDSFGLDVSIFPRIFLTASSTAFGDNRTSLLLPIWVEKDWSGGWSAFGGGGCTVTERRAVDFCQTGAVLTYQFLPKLQVGAEIFHLTADSLGTPATTSAGIGWRYDLNDNYHLLGYVARGIQSMNQTDQYSWYASVLFTF